MQININSPVGAQVNRVDATPKSTRDRDLQHVAARDRTPASADCEFYLSGTGAGQSGTIAKGAELSEAEAIRLSDKICQQLTQTSEPIANQAIQNAVDLFA